jgi:hypothetical protein
MCEFRRPLHGGTA